jgi:beta-phosphoglucomutase
VALKKKWGLGTTKGSPTTPSTAGKGLKGNAGETKVSQPLGGGDLEGAASGAFGAIFDMDGTLIDNTPYHFKSWQALFKKYGKGELSKKTYYTSISGVPVMETIERVFGADHEEAGLRTLLNEKEEFYRTSYAPFVAPVNGLESFLTNLKKSGIKMAMATSATVADIDFILDRIPIREDFDEIVNSSMVSKPKPNPLIFLKAAEKLNMPPEKCIVFEDSLAGIKAANSAGMKVIAITTGHTANELHPVDLVINDYSELTVKRLAALFEKH